MANVDLILPAPKAFPKLKDKSGILETSKKGEWGMLGANVKTAPWGVLGRRRL